MSSSICNSPNIQLVSTFSELTQTPFQGQTNALCWSRQLHGDFQEIVNKLALDDDITEVYIEDLQELELTSQGAIARDVIIEDMQLLSRYGAQPSLNLIRCYARDDEFDFIATDVYSYHVDRSPVATDTFLCTYFGAASELLPNDQVQQKILIPEIREQLSALYDGPAAGFDAFLTEYFFDLHYQPQAHAQPVNLGVGHLWRLAVDHPQQQVLPCVHRAPIEDGRYRLLLIC